MGVLLENTPEYVFLIAGAALCGGYYNNPGAGRDRLRDGDFWTGDLGPGYVLMTADRKGALEAEFARHGRDQVLRL